MKIIRPVAVTDTVLASSNVPEAEPVWSAATNYALNAIVRGNVPDTAHRLFMSLQASNLNHPLSDPAWWVETGPTNRWAMFDGSNTTLTTNADSIVVELETSSRVDSVALLNISAGLVRIEMIDDVEGVVYDQTFSLTSSGGIVDWHAYFFDPIARKTDLVVFGLPPYANSTLTVTITDTGSIASLGALVIGLSKILGETAMGASIGIQDYSRKEQNAFGDFVLVERAYSKRATFSVWTPRGFTDELQTLLASYRAVPIVYVGSEEFGSTVIFGFYRDFSIAIEYPTRSVCSLEIVGLT